MNFIKKIVKQTNFKKVDLKIYSPCDGKLKRLEYSKDAVFREKVLGEGCFVVPYEDFIRAPISGTITALFPTYHAFGITADSGAEVLVHIGIDTVELEGCFQPLVKKGEHVHRGDVCVVADIKRIEGMGKRTDVYVVVTNSNVYNKPMIDAKTVKSGEVLFELKKRGEIT